MEKINNLYVYMENVRGVIMRSDEWTFSDFFYTILQYNKKSLSLWNAHNNFQKCSQVKNMKCKAKMHILFLYILLCKSKGLYTWHKSIGKAKMHITSY